MDESGLRDEDGAIETIERNN